MGVCYIIEDCNIADAENGDGGNQPNATFLGKVLSEFKKGCQQAFQNRPQRLMAAMYNCAIQVNGEVLGKSRHIHVLLCYLYCATSVWWRRTIEWTIGSDRLLVALDQLECIELVLWGSNVSQEPVRRALSLGVWVSSDTLVCRTPPIPLALLRAVPEQFSPFLNKFDQIVNQFTVDWFDICAILLINYLLNQLLIWLDVKSNQIKS